MEKKMFSQRFVEWNFCLVENTENSLDLAQRDPGKFCGPLFPHMRDYRFLALDLGGLQSAELMLGW